MVREREGAGLELCWSGSCFGVVDVSMEIDTTVFECCTLMRQSV